MNKTFLAALAALVCSCTSLPSLKETVTIEGSKGLLVGDIERPEIKGGKAPVVIICHGLTGYRTEWHLNAVNDSLVAHGIATVRFDFNGHGQSEGPFSGMTLQNELEDLQKIYDYTAGLPWVDKSRIAVAGHSQGGFLTGVFAGDMRKEKVRCAVLLAPAACIHTMAVEGTFFGAPTALENMPDSIPFWGGRMLGKKYLEVAQEIDVFTRTAAYDGPALIVQGDKDDPWLFRDAKKYSEYVKDLEYVELPGLTHCFPEDVATPAQLATEFVLKNFRCN